MNPHLPALAALALSLSACISAAPSATRPLSMADVHEPYRYAFVNSAIECAPDWQDLPRVDVYLSPVFGYCPVSSDPQGLVAGRLAEAAHATCPGAIRVLFVSVDAHESRAEARSALRNRRSQALAFGRRVVDVGFVSALPTGSCAPPKATEAASR